jgi:Family of unknown function (DUF6941)
MVNVRMIPFRLKEPPMAEPPIVLGLTLCDYVIVEEGTRKVSLIGAFTSMAVEEFPAVSPPFSVYAALTDASGNVTIRLVVVRLDTDEEVYSFQGTAHFPDKLAAVGFYLHIQDCSFPVPGFYQFTLDVDGEWVAHRRLRVYQKGDSA